MKFHYEARDQKGDQQIGIVEASSQEAALQILDRYGLYVTTLEAGEGKPIFAREIKLLERISMKEVMLFSRQLSIMFKAQVTLVDALSTIGSQMKNKNFREKLLKMSEDVEAGTAFSEALALNPKIFSSFYVHMVKRGEALGKLSDVLEYLADHLERQYNLQSKVRGALTYPIFVLVVAVIVISLVVLFAIPNLITLLESSGQKLPLMTRFVIAFSNFYRAWWWILPFVVTGVFIGIMRLTKTTKGRRFVHVVFLKIPILSTLLKMMYITRFGENLSTLISGGVPIVQALDITGKIVGNQMYEKIISEAKNGVSEGERISDILERYPSQFPPIFTQMVRVGEKSGALSITLIDIVRFYQKEVDRSVDAFISVLEPLFIVILAVFVGGLLASIVLPMYQVISTAGGT